MNKILIVDASATNNRVLSGLLMRNGYDPIVVDSMEDGKEEVAKLPRERSLSRHQNSVVGPQES